MSAYVSQSFLDECVIDSRMLSIATAYRGYQHEGRGGEFLQMLVRSLKGISYERRQVWKQFIDVAIPRLNADVEQYKALQKAFIEGKPKKAPAVRKTKGGRW